MSLSDSDAEEAYYNADDGKDLENFIVDDGEHVALGNNETRDNNDDEEDYLNNDRLLEMTTALKPNETKTQQLLRAHISILVSVLGGVDHTSPIVPAPYKLGLDALACLKDIKRWIKSVDEKKNEFEVALACADSGLVTNDLIVILCQWEQRCKNKEVIKNARTTEKIMLACLELLVLMTWPVELNPELSENQKLLYSNVKKAQITYKKAILQYNNGQTLKAVIRLILPTLGKSKLDREPRDNAILRLVLFFIRNILFIDPATSTLSTKSSSKQIMIQDNMPSNITYDDISINTVLTAFEKNKVFMLLLTITGTIGTEFDKQIFGPICLECIHLILKGVKVSDILAYTNIKLLPNNDTQGNAGQPLQSISTTAGMQLQDLLNKEASRKRAQTQNLQSRHGRFGSLISVRTNETESFVVSGQNALLNTNSTMERLDRTKQWNARNNFKNDSDDYVKSNTPVYMTSSGRLILLEFVELFLLGGCFNNLIESMSSIFSGSGDLHLVDEYEKATFFMTISWFFNYKREKIAWYNVFPSRKELHTEKEDKLDYGSVGAALGEINFILLVSYFRSSFEQKRWSSLHAAMICFRELLLISNSLFGKASNIDVEDEETQFEIDRELAEGIIRKLFSFDHFINMVVVIPQTASKHSQDYLTVCVSIIHILLKSFETYANEDLKLYVQTKRKNAKKKKPRVNNLDKFNEEALRDVIDASDEEGQEERISAVKRERRLDFKTTEIKFFHPAIVTTYIEYFSRYEDLSHEEIKRCLSYFHRLFVVRKDFTSLFRLDFMHVIQKLRGFLPRGSSIRNHVEEFIYYFMKKFKLAFERYPNPIEILFPRFEEPECTLFLATGELYTKPETKKSLPRLAKDLEFTRDNLSIDEQVKILVTALHSQEKQSVLDFLINELDRIIQQRLVDNEGSDTLKPTSQFRRLLINNANLRFLLRIVGFELPYIMDEPCTLPSSVSNEKATEYLDLIKKWHSQQPVTFEDGKDASFFLRSSDVYVEGTGDTEYNEFYDDENEAIAFETAPNANADRTNFSELDRLDELERALSSSGSTLSSGLEKGRARVKNKRPKENKQKQPKLRPPTTHRRSKYVLLSDDERMVKSAQYIHDSDDESDDDKEREFFEREERLRQLLGDSGGIVNPEQLKEFRKVWSRLELNRKSIKSTKEPSLFLGDSEDEKDVIEPFVEVSTSKLTKANTPDSNSESEKYENFSSQTSDLNNETPNTEEDAPRKRKQMIEDEDEADTEESESENVARSEPPRKKRLILGDDEE